MAQTSSGFDQDKTERAATNQKELVRVGYMQDEKDWRNVEISGHFRNTYGDDGEFIMSMRGAIETDPQPYCPGFGYKVNIAYGSGEIRGAKECYGVSYDHLPWEEGIGSWGEWIGLKYVIYNFNASSRIFVKLEVWADKNLNNEWEKVWEHTDTGSWGIGCEECGGDEDQLGTWGGPLAIFQTLIGKVEARNLSVREIQPGGPDAGSGAGGNDEVSGTGCTDPGTGGGQEVAGLIYQTTGRSNSNFKDWGRDSTNYASGGSGPSRRWNCEQQGSERYLNCIVVAKINIGNDLDSDDNVAVKFRGCTHNDSNGGWYSIGVEFNGKPIFGKEYPHPSTRHYSADGESNSMGSIKGKNIAIQCIMYNDGNTPTMELWHDVTGNGTTWKFGGKKRDTGNLDPGPVLTEIGVRGDKCQQIQIRIDEAPDAKLISATAYEMKMPPTKSGSGTATVRRAQSGVRRPLTVNGPNGVKQIFKTKGTHRTNFELDDDDSSSLRWNFANPPTNMELTGYFKGSGSNDTISCKIRGGRHTSSAPNDGCCYIPQIPTQGGAPRYQVECPHPENHNCPFTKRADTLGMRSWRGVKVAIWNTAQNCVHWELYEDQGNNDSTPSNQWVKVGEHTDCDGNCGDIDEPLLQPKGSTSQATFRIDENSNTQGKWLSVVEIENTGALADGGGGATPPGGGSGGGNIPDNWDFHTMGGPVLSPAKIIPIFWGSAWDDARNPSMQEVANDISTLCSSNYWNIMSLYDIQKPQVVGQGARLGNAPNSVTNDRIKEALNSAITNLDAPTPQEDPNSLYILFMNKNQSFASGLIPDTNQNAEHGSYTVGGSGGQPSMKAYTIVIRTAGLDRAGISRIMSQMVTNTISNPDQNQAWVAKDSSRCQSSEITNEGQRCELGDYCSNVQGTISGVAVTGIWSNTDQKCVTDGTFSQPVACPPGSGIESPPPPPPENLMVSALVIYSIGGWGSGSNGGMGPDILSPIPPPPTVEDGYIAVHATVLYNEGSNFASDPRGGTSRGEGGPVFPETPAPVGQVVVFNRHRYNIAVYSTTHCLNP